MTAPISFWRTLSGFSDLQTDGVHSMYVTKLYDRLEVSLNVDKPHQVQALADALVEPPLAPPELAWRTDEGYRSTYTDMFNRDRSIRVWVSCVLPKEK